MHDSDKRKIRVREIFVKWVVAGIKNQLMLQKNPDTVNVKPAIIDK
jgi:hypothetical protein